jgi:high-affinity iron transporter
MLHAVVLAACTPLAGAPRAADAPSARHERAATTAAVVAAALGAPAATVSAATAAGASAPAPSAAERDIQHALGLLDYVAGDYDGAVGADRRIRHEHEYDEQKGLLQRAETLLAGAPGLRSNGVMQEMRAVRAACAARVAPADFVPRLRRLHARIVREFGVQLTPQFVPSLAVGRLIYTQSCAVCHGDDGAARTPQAAGLDPRPRDLTAPELATRLSPYAVFNAVTFGVPGTAMASFEALPEEERWGVAFWVLSLRQGRDAPAVAPAAGNASAGASPAGGWQPTLRDLALATDAELAARLAAWPAPARAAQIARWRSQLPLEIGE